MTAVDRNRFLDYAKGSLIFLVTWGHIIQWTGYSDDGYWSDAVFKLIYMFHMPLFMAIGGYLAFRSINRDSVATTFAKRFNGLVVPIFAWAVPFHLVLWTATRDAPVGAAGLLQAFIGGVVHDLWFLWALFSASVAFAVLRHLRCDKPIYGLAMVLLMLAVPGPALLKYVLPYFAIGYFLAKHEDRLRFLYRPVLIGSVGFVASGVCYAMWDERTYVYVSKMALTGDNGFVVLFRYVASAIVGVTALALMYLLYHVTPQRDLVRLGQGSLYVYILQIYFFIVLTAVWDGTHALNGSLWYSLAFAPMTAMVFSFGFLELGVTANRFPRLARVFFGRPTDRRRDSVPADIAIDARA